MVTRTGEQSRLTFAEREFKGSRYRCLLATSKQDDQVAAFLTSLVAPYATVCAEHHYWAPAGFLRPEEAKLGETPGFVSGPDQKILSDWWLKVKRGANIPNWDIASTCDIDGKPGVLLVEAKAHENELANDTCGAKNTSNMAQIDQALADAAAGLNALLPGFQLSKSSHFQLSNRFAFAWKLATMGCPVTLVYLGFLHADEMAVDGKKTFQSHAHWRNHIVEHAKGIIPPTAWDRTFHVPTADGNGTTPLTVLLCSATVRIHAE